MSLAAAARLPPPPNNKAAPKDGLAASFNRFVQWLCPMGLSSRRDLHSRLRLHSLWFLIHSLWFVIPAGNLRLSLSRQAAYTPAGRGSAGSNFAICTFFARPSFSITQMP